MQKIICKKIIFVLLVSSIVVLCAYFIMDAISTANRRVIWTTRSLGRIRVNIDQFVRNNNANPNSLREVNIISKEFISDFNGRSFESSILNGNGGWFYDKATGNVKINLNKSVKKYLPFYFGEERNQMPSDW